MCIEREEGRRHCRVRRWHVRHCRRLGGRNILPALKLERARTSVKEKDFFAKSFARDFMQQTLIL